MGTILFVDDEKLILNSLKRGLRNQDFDCFYATSGEEALQIISKMDIDVMFTDMKMPNMNGLELSKAVEKSNPDIVKVIISGYAQLPQLIATINQTNIYKYIAKPFDLYQELVPVIKDAIEFSVFKRERVEKAAMLESKNNAYKNMLNTMKFKTTSKDSSYDIIKIYQQVFLALISEQVKNPEFDVPEHISAIEHYKRFSNHFLEEMKKNEIYFEPNRIINEIEYLLKKDGYKVSIEKGVDEHSRENYYGRGMHIKPVITCVIEDYVKKDAISTIRIIAKEASRGEGNAEINYIIEMPKLAIKSLRLDFYNTVFYKKLLNIFGGDIEIIDKGSNLCVLVKVMLKISEEEDSHEFTDR